MILLLDIGNSFIKWTLVVEAGSSIEEEKVHYFDHRKTELHLFWQEVSSNIEQDPFDTTLAIACVRRSILNRLLDSCPERLKQTLFVAKTESNFNQLCNAYKTPSNMGIDRWLAMIGAFEGRGIMVVDLGTAITVDVVTDQGQHIGGFIVPGLQSQLKTLLQSTENVWTKQQAEWGITPGTDTFECVNHGLMAQTIGFLSHQIHVMRAAHRIDSIVLTGGDAVRCFPVLENALLEQNISLQYRPNLIFEGLLASLLKYRKKI